MTLWVWFAPQWARAVYFGCVYAAVMFIVFVLLDLGGGQSFGLPGPRWEWAAPTIAIGATIFGILATRVNRKVTDEFALSVEELSAEDRKIAYRASIRGQVPGDPQVRASALRICQLWLEGRRKRGRLVVIILSLAAAAMVFPVVSTIASGAGFRGAAGQLLVLAILFVAAASDAYIARRYRTREALLTSIV